MSSEVYRTPDERFLDLPGFPFEPRYVDLDGLRMHRVDEGSGSPILMLHGEPTWSYLYRKMIGPLAAGHRVIAPDLFGFGRSDKPTERGFYTYDMHTLSIAHLVEELDLKRTTLVVHDWGGPIGLRVAFERPGRFARLVILNTGLALPGPRWPSAGFTAWRDFVERVGLELPVGSIVQRSTVSELPPDVIAAYDAPFPEPTAKTGPATFPLLVPIHQDDPDVPTMRAVRESLRSWTKPTLVMFSDADPVIPISVGERLAETTPGAEGLVRIEGASHFLQEDAGEELAERIGDWLEGS